MNHNIYILLLSYKCMRKEDILAKEIANLNPDGSLKKRIFGGIPAKETVEGIKREMEAFNVRMLKAKIKSLEDLAPYISEHLERFGAISGQIKASEPMYIGSDEYSSSIEYSFLGKSVEEKIKMEKEDIKEYFQEIKDNFASYFPKNSTEFLDEGKIILR